MNWLLAQGLLAMKNVTDTHFVAYDGNGNVMNLVKASNGASAATYEYGPFGESIRVSGAAISPIRFSTKYQDEETDLVYFGFRYYTPFNGRWLSRDPIEERGGENLHEFVRNCPIGNIDTDGREITMLDHGDEIGGVIKYRKLIGDAVKGIVVGTFKYPRKNTCGCWKRNIYADFTPIITQALKHHKEWWTYQDDFSLDANALDIMAQLTSYSFPGASAGEIAGDPLNWAGLLASILAHQQRKLDTQKFKVTLEYNLWDLGGDLSWSMGETYKKKGESTKISNITCKPETTYNIKQAMDSLIQRIPHFSTPISYMPEGPTQRTVTPL